MWGQFTLNYLECFEKGYEKFSVDAEHLSVHLDLKTVFKCISVNKSKIYWEIESSLLLNPSSYECLHDNKTLAILTFQLSKLSEFISCKFSSLPTFTASCLIEKQNLL